MTPFIRQLLVVVSPQLAAFAVGGAVTYPGALLQQLKANDSTIRLDMDTATWIGSIHGLTGIPSIFMPIIMQWKGRKFSFIAACLLNLIGWITAYASRNTVEILISESFQGLGTHCSAIVSLLSISEMVTPRFRNTSMVSFYLTQAVGIATMGILSKFCHWKTISLIMSVPVTLALLIACLWPESPSWLAYKGKFDECEQAFMLLRGKTDDVKKELQDIIASHKEHLTFKDGTNTRSRNYIWNTVKRRDFYIPCFFTFLLLNLVYWSGTLVILIYSNEIVKRVTENENAAAFSTMTINCIVFVGIATTTTLIRFFNNKSVLMVSIVGTSMCLIICFVVSYLQTIGTLPKKSMISFYCIIAYMIGNSLGINSIPLTTAAEIMPVKHRGLGGAVYVIFVCLLHTSSLKLSPYLFIYVDMWGTYLIYTISTVSCGILIWIYVPETKGKTLQEIEDYYIDLKFRKRRDCAEIRKLKEIHVAI